MPRPAVVIIGSSWAKGTAGLVPVRYRYRLCPLTGTEAGFSPGFGCARVVYNDCLRLQGMPGGAAVRPGAA